MMKLLNRDYGAPVRGIAASLGYGLATLTTGQPVLARELAGRLWGRGFQTRRPPRGLVSAAQLDRAGCNAG